MELPSAPLIDALPLTSVCPAVIEPFLLPQLRSVVASIRALPPTPRSPLTHSAHGVLKANGGKRSTGAWTRRCDFVRGSATELFGVHLVDVICRWLGLPTGSGVVTLTT